MTATYTGQLILGTDKRNPLFTVYAQEEEDEKQLHVFYGLELLEAVSADRNELRLWVPEHPRTTCRYLRH